tara:strand:- start:2154 stop:2465 length:312 start_codon:yes stop_codon:yes gene_type:complete
MGEHAALLSMLTGPTSSLVLLLSILWAVWKAVTQSVIPAVKVWVDKHLTQVDQLLESHGNDRDAWLESMRSENARHQEITASLDRIERKVGGLYSRLPAKEAG